MSGYEFTDDEIEDAWDNAGGVCECCGKQLSWDNQGRNAGWGCWEAHHGGRNSPVILCSGGKEDCHLNCGHDGDFQNPGITPQYHRGG